jgi:hypothetical protein
MRYKIFHMYSVCCKNFSTTTEYAVKNFPQLLRMPYKNVLFLEFLNIHKRPKTLNFSKTHCRYTYGPKNKHHQLLRLALFQFFLVSHTRRMVQKNKNPWHQGSVNKKIVPLPKSHTQTGSLSVKNASIKLSRLGTFNFCNRFCISFPSKKKLPRPSLYAMNLSK